MDIKEFQELVTAIRNAFSYTYNGLTTKEVQELDRRLDSDAYNATVAVVEYFENKRKQNGTNNNR